MGDELVRAALPAWPVLGSSLGLGSRAWSMAAGPPTPSSSASPSRCSVARRSLHFPGTDKGWALPADPSPSLCSSPRCPRAGVPVSQSGMDRIHPATARGTAPRKVPLGLAAAFHRVSNPDAREGACVRAHSVSKASSLDKQVLSKDLQTS